jgi:hypothetical protein
VIHDWTVLIEGMLVHRSFLFHGKNLLKIASDIPLASILGTAFMGRLLEWRMAEFAGCESLYEVPSEILGVVGLRAR